jgi:hypothetical protein
LKRDWARVISIGGALVVIMSVAWEYARMKPDNKYLVLPWAYRGYESIHGTVFVVIGAALLICVLLVASKASQKLRNSIAIVAGMVVAGWLIAIVFASGEDVTVASDSIVAFLLAVAIGIGITFGATRLAESRSLDAVANVLSGATGALVKVVVIFLFTIVLGLLIGDELTIPAHIGILVVMLVLGTLMSLMRTPSMAANRMLLASTLVAGTAIGFSGAAIRSTLTRFQSETEPFIASEYRDTQVTWGYFLANIGVILVFAGAVMLWARRRDIVQSQQRAAKQREAADASARELAAAK